MDTISDVQWLWYASMLFKDHDESFEENRNLTEYLASFTNPEEVSRIQKHRDMRSELSQDNENAFDDSLKSLFGKSLDGKEVVDISKNDNKNDEKTKVVKREVKEEELEKYMDMDLDEVVFIPE